MDPITVALAEPYPAIREAVSARLEETPDLQLGGTYESAAAGLAELGERLPDVVVAEFMLSGARRLDVIEQIRTRHPAVEVVIFSRHPEEIYAERALRKGACSYLMKTASTDRLLAAIRSAYRGRVYLSPQMSKTILNQLGEHETARPSFPIDQLTDRERAVFQMLGRGQTIEEIMGRLEVSRKTVEGYRRRAKEKLGLASINELLQFALLWARAHSPETA